MACQSYTPFRVSPSEVVYSGSSVSPLETDRSNVRNCANPRAVAKCTGLGRLRTFPRSVLSADADWLTPEYRQSLKLHYEAYCRYLPEGHLNQIWSQ